MTTWDHEQPSLGISDAEFRIQLEILASLGVPRDVAHVPLTAALYLQHFGGPAPSAFWNDTVRDGNSQLIPKQRAEYFLSAASAISLSRIFAKPPKGDWRVEFDVAYLFFLKRLAQSTVSINQLCLANCYSDAFAVIRAMHTRVNLLALFALGPHLFDEWLKFPKDNRFLDGRIREELANHGINTYPHLYEHFSEIVHEQYPALEETGYMETGLFPSITAIENQALVAGKLLFGIAGWVGLTILKTDNNDAKDLDLEEATQLYDFLVEDVLQPNRWDHLFTSIGKERHWKPSGKNKVVLAEWFSYQEFCRQVALFHRPSQPKELGKHYRRKKTPRNP